MLRRYSCGVLGGLVLTLCRVILDSRLPRIRVEPLPVRSSLAFFVRVCERVVHGCLSCEMYERIPTVRPLPKKKLCCHVQELDRCKAAKRNERECFRVFPHWLSHRRLIPCTRVGMTELGNDCTSHIANEALDRSSEGFGWGAS